MSDYDYWNDDRTYRDDVTFSDSPDVKVETDGERALLTPLSNRGWMWLARAGGPDAERDGYAYVIARDALRSYLEGMANSGLTTRIGAK